MALSLSAALVRLGCWLRQTGYQFTTLAPASHARVNERPGTGVAHNLRDVFGWSQPFAPGLLPAEAPGWAAAPDRAAWRRRWPAGPKGCPPSCCWLTLTPGRWTLRSAERTKR